MPTPRQQICHFYSQNTRCAATLHWPEQAATPAENTPAILMAHGWGGIQGLLIEDFIHHFVAAGLVVMTFDYIGSIKELIQWMNQLDLQDAVLEEPDLETIFMNYYQ